MSVETIIRIRGYEAVLVGGPTAWKPRRVYYTTHDYDDSNYDKFLDLIDELNKDWRGYISGKYLRVPEIEAAWRAQEFLPDEVTIVSIPDWPAAPPMGMIE